MRRILGSPFDAGIRFRISGEQRSTVVGSQRTSPRAEGRVPRLVKFLAPKRTR
ncbi:MAG: hypothetical protein ACXVEF_12515 [Polyangiales bacterium]